MLNILEQNPLSEFLNEVLLRTEEKSSPNPGFHFPTFCLYTKANIWLSVSITNYHLQKQYTDVLQVKTEPLQRSCR